MPPVSRPCGKPGMNKDMAELMVFLWVLHQPRTSLQDLPPLRARCRGGVRKTWYRLAREVRGLVLPLPTAWRP